MSRRLKAVALLAGRGDVLSDVGTDHGYVPIFLVAGGMYSRAIAMDVRPGPLERARENIAHFAMEEYIQTRLSDGVAALRPGEADTILLAGMGGGLIMRILKDGRTVCRGARKLVLQPQSELPRVRRFLDAEGYATDAEDMVEEDGKFYPMMRVHYVPAGCGEKKDYNVKDFSEAKTMFPIKGCGGNVLPGAGNGSPLAEGAGTAAGNETVADEVCFRYGRLLLEKGHPVLGKYLAREREIYSGILAGLRQQPAADGIVRRIREVEDVLRWNGEAAERWGLSCCGGDHAADP